MALARVEQTEQGEIHHAVHLAELSHRGEEVHKRMGKRAGYRRRRRSANLRYRPARIQNRYCVQMPRADGYEYEHGEGRPDPAPNKAVLSH